MKPRVNNSKLDHNQRRCGKCGFVGIAIDNFHFTHTRMWSKTQRKYYKVATYCAWCKDCMNEYNRAYNQARRETKLAQVSQK